MSPGSKRRPLRGSHRGAKMDLTTATRDPCTCHHALDQCPACAAWHDGYVLIHGVRACTRAAWQAAYSSGSDPRSTWHAICSTESAEV